jgi:prepilin signal peptidase PulO-like enzyme (type II secretory pathway)
MINIFLIFILFVLGTAIGSFLNVVSRRLLRGESIGGRSHCESCGRTLSAPELVPLVSFLLLKGRCRSCQGKLSWQYPLVEGGTAVLFVSLGIKFAPNGFGYQLATLLPLLAASSALIVIFVTDLFEERVFDRVVLVGAFFAIAYRLLVHLNPTSLDFDSVGMASDLLLGVGVFLFFFLLRLVTRGRGMGSGDPPVGALSAFLVGFPQGLVAVFLAFALGALVGLFLIFLGKKRFGEHVPFAPFLVLSVFASIFFGDQILSWYLGTLGF